MVREAPGERGSNKERGGELAEQGALERSKATLCQRSDQGKPKGERRDGPGKGTRGN